MTLAEKRKMKQEIIEQQLIVELKGLKWPAETTLMGSNYPKQVQEEENRGSWNMQGRNSIKSRE
jgi:hypothetical protein